jgi:hypothetical protein
MGKVSIIFVLATIAVGSIDAQYYINNVLLSPRMEYTNLKWNCFEYIDSTFNRAYSTLNSTIFNIIDFNLKQQSLTQTCNSFNTSLLNKTVRTNFKTAMKSLNMSFSQAVPKAEGALTSFMSLLGAAPDLMEIMQDLYAAVQDTLANMVPHYVAKPACVGTLLRNFTNQYRLISNEFCAVYHKVHNNISRIFSNASFASRNAANHLNSFRMNLSNCNRNPNPNECVGILVNISLMPVVYT